MQYGMPLNFNGWLKDNADRFKPPVNNQQIWANADFICTTNTFKLNYGKHTACVWSPQLNLVEVGNIVNEEQVNGAKVWEENTTDLSKTYLYLFNNYWHTNYKAYQEGFLGYGIDFWME